MFSLVSSLNMDVVLKILAPFQPITLHLIKSLCIFGCHCTDSCFCPLTRGDEALDFSQLGPITLVSTFVLTNLWRPFWCLVKDTCLVVSATIYHILQKSTHFTFYRSTHQSFFSSALLAFWFGQFFIVGGWPRYHQDVQQDLLGAESSFPSQL